MEHRPAGPAKERQKRGPARARARAAALSGLPTTLVTRVAEQRLRDTDTDRYVEAWSETVDFLKNVRTRSKTGMETPALEAEVEGKSKELNDDTSKKLTSLQEKLKPSKRTAGGSRRREAGERG